MRDGFQTFLRQVQLQQWTEAQQSADRISTHMGATHVMSLRAQGYLSLRRGNLVQAKTYYLQLQQALPDDREAGLNLALIDWRSGDKEAASRRVGALEEKFPSDPEVRALSHNVRTP